MIPPRFAVFLAVAAAAFLLPSSALAAPTVSDDGRRAAFSPEEVRRSDSRALAETLVRRLHRFCDLAGVPDPGGRRPGPDFDLIMMVPHEVLDSVARYGFLNQHQTLTTGGFDRLSARFAAEQELAMLRLPYDSKGRELLPKYAVLNIRRPGYGAFSLPARYGDVAVVFKTEVRSRTTWTYADSLDYSRTTGRFAAGGAANPVLPHTLEYPGKAADRNVCGNYCEAQIWGKLSWADVDYVMISTAGAVPDSVRRTGRPAYRYEAAPMSGQTAQFVRGERVVTAPVEEGGPGDSPAPGVATYLRGESDARLDDGELARREESAGRSAAERRRLLGDLAIRMKTPVVVRALERASVSPDADVRALALYGLSDLPWAKFKPRLLSALNDADSTVEIQAAGLAWDHLDDLQIAQLLKAIERRLNAHRAYPADAAATPAWEWLERVRTGKLCGR